MLHLVNGYFCISSHQVWRPGTYATEKAARWAFQFNDEVLQTLCDKVNKGEQREITTDDLRAVR